MLLEVMLTSIFSVLLLEVILTSIACGCYQVTFEISMGNAGNSFDGYSSLRHSSGDDESEDDSGEWGTARGRGLRWNSVNCFKIIDLKY